MTDTDAKAGVVEEHTPGPWTWRQGQCADPEQWSLSPGILMADERDGTPGGDKIDRANAHLIASAPDLMAACLRMRTYAAFLRSEFGDDTEVEADLAALEAAIAQAQGGAA